MALVLRKRPGDEIGLFDGKGRTFLGRIEAVGPRRVEGRVLAARSAALPPFEIRLLQAMPKGDKFDWILQKAAELGVSEIVPVTTHRTVARIPAERVSGRVARWQKIVLSAAEQSGRAHIPVVRPPVDFRRALDLCAEAAVTLIPWEGEERTGLKDVLRKTVLDRVSRQPAALNVFIGPEGGFTAEEVELARTRGAVPVSLGSAILRAETAAVFVVSVLLYEFGEGD